MTSVVVCDDFALLTHFFRNEIESSSNFKVIATVNNVADCLKLFESGFLPDILTLDISMPNGLNGYDVAKVIQNKYSSINVVVITMNNNLDVLHACIRLGVKAFIPKDCIKRNLVEILEIVARGGYSFPKEFNLTHQAIKKLHDTPTKLIESITYREKEFMQHLSAGKSYKEIAKEMKISQNTVENKRVSLFAKTGVTSKTALLSMFKKLGID